jgi:hypothetical protein
MKYFHRTSLPLDAALAAAKTYFGARLAPAEESPRRLAYSGALGKVAISVKADGGHYTFVEAQTDQVGESELDKLTKRFLAELHQAVEPTHAVRGAY